MDNLKNYITVFEVVDNEGIDHDNKVWRIKLVVRKREGGTHHVRWRVHQLDSDNSIEFKIKEDAVRYFDNKIGVIEYAY